MSKLKQSFILSAVSLLLIPTLYAAQPQKMATPKADIFIIQEAQSLPIVLKYPASI